MRFLILGGAGGVANVIARVLAGDALVDRILLADLDVERAKTMAAGIGGDKVEARFVDLRDKESVRGVVRECDIVVNSSWDDFNRMVTDVVLEERKDLLDLSSSLEGDELLQCRRQDEAEDAGVRAILGMGEDSGLSDLFALQMVRKLDEVDSIAIRDGDVDLEPHAFPFKFTMHGIMDEWTWPAIIYEGGKFRLVPPLSEHETVHFPKPIGTLETYTCVHEEVATLPRFLPKPVGRVDFMLSHPYALVSTLRDLGLLSAEPVRVGSEKISPLAFVTKVLSAKQANMTDPSRPVKDATCVMVRCRGTRKGEKTELVQYVLAWNREDWNACATHYITGLSAALGALWLARGKVTRPGFWPPEACVDPDAFLDFLRSRCGRWVHLA